LRRTYLVQFLLAISLCLGLIATALAQGSGSHETGPQTPTPEPTARPTDEVIGPAIVGGNPADPAEYPWQAALVSAFSPSPLFGQFCAGSLIDPEWVLTAAHCLESSGIPADPASIDVVVGVNKLSDGPTTGSQGQRLDVLQVIIHPDYDPSTDDSDIGLLRLASPAILGPAVDTIPVVGPAELILVTPGVTATVTGWGATVEGGAGSNLLLEVELPLISHAVCNAPQSYNGAITANMLCAGLAAGGKDSCQGDSGGPLVVPDGLGDFIQAGVVSWGTGCARPDLYGVYTRVSRFKSWIDEQLSTELRFFYFPFIFAPPCPPLGESDNIPDALTINSGQKICGQVSQPGDPDDVYRIFATAGQQLTITLNGSGGNADLYLYAPGATDIITSPAAAFSTGPTSAEFIQLTASSTGFWYIDILAASGVVTYRLNVTLN
jgi:hypothetical protein